VAKPLRDAGRRHDALAAGRARRALHVLVTGAKWNVASTWLVNANVLIRVTDAGLRVRVTPAISIDYSFER